MTRHPCGALPLRTLQIFVHFCVHHQAYFATVSELYQDSDDPVLASTATVEFGPFDDAQDVHRWLSSTTERHLRR